MASPSATEQVFNTPELLEMILCWLPVRSRWVSAREDPRSGTTHFNAAIVSRLLHCTEVSRAWYACIHGSVLLKRQLFLHAVHDSPSRAHKSRARSWSYQPRPSDKPDEGDNHSRHPNNQAPILNPLIQTTFPSYSFRFWHVSPVTSDPTIETRHNAFMIITRRNLRRIKEQSCTRSSTFASMLLSQPPCLTTHAMVLEERGVQETELDDPVIHADRGITLGMLHERVQGWFDKYEHVHAIKFMF